MPILENSVREVSNAGQEKFRKNVEPFGTTAERKNGVFRVLEMPLGTLSRNLGAIHALELKIAAPILLSASAEDRPSRYLFAARLRQF